MFRTKFSFTDANWLESIKRYVLDVDATILDLHHLDLKIEDVKAILEFLANSTVCNLDLSFNNFENQMAILSPLLVKTKIKELNVSKCGLYRNDTRKLMSHLKHTKITVLDISGNNCQGRGNIKLNPILPHFMEDFLTELTKSNLTTLLFHGSGCFNRGVDVCWLFSIVCSTSITHLNLDSLSKDPKHHDSVLSLFHCLKNSAITHLSFAKNDLCHCKSLDLGNSLRESKLIQLVLSHNLLSDQHLDELFKALVGTEIAFLNLSNSSWAGSINIFSYLKETKITRLNLGRNTRKVTSDNLFNFPHFLSGTSVGALNLEKCGLSDEIGVKIMNGLKCSNLEELDVSCNLFKKGTLLEFYCAVTKSAVTSINLGGIDDKFIRSISGSEPYGVANFFETLNNSKVTSVKLRSQRLGTQAAKIAFPSLANSKLTNLDLGCNYLGGGLSSLAAVLKFTVLTHLNLESNRINDINVEALAVSLKETKIMFLNLGGNNITDTGAEALAISLKGTDILNLDLNCNKIGNPGLQSLASNVAETLITSLNVGGNPGNRRIVETETWNNRRLILQLVRFFKLIAPDPGTNTFNFEDYFRKTDIDTFRGDCINFYSLVVERSSVSLVLSQDETIAMERELISSLLLVEFPKQFVRFTVTKIEAEVSERIKFLKKVEEMQLTGIVELLLLHQLIYTIDKSQGILHPYVYELLSKYNLPIFKLEPED